MLATLWQSFYLGSLWECKTVEDINQHKLHKNTLSGRQIKKNIYFSILEEIPSVLNHYLKLVQYSVIHFVHEMPIFFNLIHQNDDQKN